MQFTIGLDAPKSSSKYSTESTSPSHHNNVSNPCAPNQSVRRHPLIPCETGKSDAEGNQK